jgi:hypothetical protein
MLGDEGPDTLTALRAAMIGYYLQEGDKPLPLHRCLGTGGARVTRAALRRHHLLRAAATLPGPTSWARCKQLAEACRIFEVRRYPTWRRMDSPPGHASELDRVLWSARQFGQLACTPEAYTELLSDT